MEYVEDLRKRGIDAKIEAIDQDCSSCSRVTLRSFEELQEFISFRFSNMLVNGITTSIPLDDFERLVSEVSTHLLDESHTIIGRILV